MSPQACFPQQRRTFEAPLKRCPRTSSLERTTTVFAINERTSNTRSRLRFSSRSRRSHPQKPDLLPGAYATHLRPHRSRQPAIQRLRYQTREEALSQARKADKAQGKFLGVFHGVLSNIKESFGVAGHPATWVFPRFKDVKAQANSDAAMFWFSCTVLGARLGEPTLNHENGSGETSARSLPYRDSDCSLPVGAAMPRKTRTARFNRTMSSSARRPTRAPILAFETVVILSTIKRHRALSPFASLGSMGRRNRGASVGSVVNAQTVIESVMSKRSS